MKTYLPSLRDEVPDGVEAPYGASAAFEAPPRNDAEHAIRIGSGSRLAMIHRAAFKMLSLILVLILVIFSSVSEGIAAIEDIRPVERDLRFTGETLELTAGETVRLAVLQSLDIKISRLERLSKNQEVMKAKSVYDTTFASSFDWEENRFDKASTITGSREVTGNFDFGVTKKLPLGTALEGAFENQRRSTGSLFATLDPSYESVYRFGFAQPLLKNAFGFLDRANIELIEIDVERFDYETQNRIEETVAGILDSYWQLVFFYESFLVRLEGLEWAKRFFAITEDKFSFGLAEAPELYAAEANVRNRLGDAVKAKYELEHQRNQLRFLLDLAGWDRIVPLDEPRLDDAPVSLEGAIIRAFKNRRDYKQVLLDLEASDLSVRMKRNSLWPQLDIEGSYSANGLDTQSENAAGEVFGFNHPKYFGKAVLTYPLENRQARSEYRQAKYGSEKKLLEFKKLEQEIYRELDDRVREVLMMRERSRLSLKARDLQAKKLEAEMQNLERGRSSTKTIIDFQDDVIAAKLRALEDLTGYERAKNRLSRAEHALLADLGVIES